LPVLRWRFRLPASIGWFLLVGFALLTLSSLPSQTANAQPPNAQPPNAQPSNAQTVVTNSGCEEMVLSYVNSASVERQGIQTNPKELVDASDRWIVLDNTPLKLIVPNTQKLPQPATLGAAGGAGGQTPSNSDGAPAPPVYCVKIVFTNLELDAEEKLDPLNVTSTPQGDGSTLLTVQIPSLPLGMFGFGKEARLNLTTKDGKLSFTRMMWVTSGAKASFFAILFTALTYLFLSYVVYRRNQHEAPILLGTQEKRALILSLKQEAKLEDAFIIRLDEALKILRPVKKYPERWCRRAYLWLDPVVITSGEYGNASLAGIQILWFTMIVAFLLWSGLLRSISLPTLSADILKLLGIAASGTVSSIFLSNVRQRISLENWDWLLEKKILSDAPPFQTASRRSNPARWSDLVLSYGAFDPTRFQLVIFSLISGITLLLQGVPALANYVIPSSMATLLGLSNLVYVFGKAVLPASVEELNMSIDKARLGEVDEKTLVGLARSLRSIYGDNALHPEALQRLLAS
jgi:hypothetical protein